MPRTRKLPAYQRPERDHVEIEPTAVRGELPDMLTRTMTATGAFDADAMTITAVVATDTPVMRRDARGLYNEVLDPAGVDLSVEDVPLLDTHNSRTVRATLGRAFNFRREGNAILFYSSDAEELAHLCHRVLVMREGRVAAELTAPGITAEDIVSAAVRDRGAPVPVEELT